MNRNKIRLPALAATITFIAFCVCFGGAGVSSKAPAQAAKDARTQVIVDATTAFLKSLGDDQRKKVQFPFATRKEPAIAAKFKGGMGGRMTFVGEKYGEAVWSNFPTSDVPRPGLRLGDLSGAPRAAATHLLQALLSARGYEKVVEIMGSDQVLKDGVTPFDAGNDSYTIGIFGSPSPTKPWMVQFGGHHLALNITIAGERGVSMPTLTGAQPALYTAKGKTVRPLGRENDKAFDLMGSLDETQRKQAILNRRVSNLVLGPGHDGEKISPEGLKASAMNERQRAKLLDLISEWAGMVNEVYASARMEEIKAGLDATYFAWSGPTTREEGKNGTAYFRIQGPKVVIEFSPQGGGPGGPGAGGPTMHVHTVYRDPGNDYGRQLTNE